MSEGSKNEDCDLFNFLEYCAEGKNYKINSFLKNNNLSQQQIDKGIRICLSKFSDKKNYRDTLKELYLKTDLNYVNEDNTNLIMILCEKGSLFLIEFLLNQAFKHEKTEIDLCKHDKNGKNFIHKLLEKNSNEKTCIIILEKLLDYNEKLVKKKYSNKELLLQNDNNGNTPLTLILQRGWNLMLKTYFKYVNFEKYISPINNNNLLHFAVEGKKYTCLKMILNYSNLDDLKLKNKENYTPAALANKIKYFYIAKILESYENNFQNSEFKNLIINDPVDINVIISNYIENNFSKCLLYLNQYKLNQTILSDLNNRSFEWNLLLTKRKILLLQKKELEKEKILSKFLSNNKNDYIKEEKKQIIVCLQEMSKFFIKCQNDEKFNSNDEEILDIIIYNKIIFYLKIGDYYNVIKNINYYLTNFFKENDLKYYNIIIYIMISYILFEYLINNGKIEYTNILLENFQSNLYSIYEKKKFEKNEIISKYLIENEIYSPFSPSWDEIFCYIHLIRSFYLESNKSECLAEFKKIYKNCNYVNKYNIFKRLYSIYYMIKIKNFYKNHLFSKFYNKINLLRNKYFDYSNEHKLFYYNSIGILNLKLKNYLNSEYMFKTAIEIYKNIFSNYTKKNLIDDSLIPKKENIIYLKYNLALTFFYQKKYEKCYEILSELIKCKLVKNNIYLWYRLGITCIELYLYKINLEKKNYFLIKTNNYKNEFNNKNKFEKYKNNIKDKKNNNNNYDFDDELLYQFEEEYGEKKINDDSKYYCVNNKEKKSYKCIILNSEYNYSEKYIFYLNEAINAFKKILLINKKNESKKMNYNFDEFKIIKNLYNFYTKSNVDNEKLRKIFMQENNINSNILLSVYYNLLFALSLSKKYYEILYLINSLNIENIINGSKDNIFNYFKIEALLNMGKINEVNSLINNLINKNKDIFRIEIFDKNSNQIINDINTKIYFKTTLIFSNIKIKKYEQAKIDSINMIKEDFIDKKINIPIIYYNIMVYLFLLQGEKNKALKFIKNRNFLKIINENI
jgi:hypothetical protein